MKSKINIPIELSRKSGKTLKGGNQMLSSNDRNHRFVANQIKIYLRDLGESLGKTNKPKQPFSPKKPCKITITVFAPTSRRMDPPNWYPTVKAIIDGMTAANFWTDDDYTVIKAMTFQYGGKSGHKNYILDFLIEEI